MIKKSILMLIICLIFTEVVFATGTELIEDFVPVVGVEIEKGTEVENEEVKIASNKTDVSILFNGELIKFKDQKPILKDGIIMVPLREPLELLQWDVEWDPGDKIAIVRNEKAIMFLSIGKDRILIRNFGSPDILSDRMDELPLVLNGSVMIPLRSVVELMGMDVEWNRVEQAVYITTPVKSD